jgi:hypothetical protein
MKLSKQHKLMIAEAVASIAIGYLDNTAGTILTVASVGLHLHFDRQSRQSCPYQQIIKGKKVQQRFSHFDTPLPKGEGILASSVLPRIISNPLFGYVHKHTRTARPRLE